MMELTKTLKTSWFGLWLVGVLCVLVLTLVMPHEAAATAVEYSVLLALIIVVCINDIVASEVPQDGRDLHALASQFQAAAFGAGLANSSRNRAQEISGLNETTATAEALMDLTSSCETCDQLRTHLQQIIEVAASLKSQAHKVAHACHPDGVSQRGEHCRDGCECEPTTRGHFAPLVGPAR